MSRTDSGKVLLDLLKSKFKKYHLGWDDAACYREMVVSVNRGNYSWPTSAIIELNGSPPKMSLFIDFYYSWHRFRDGSIYGLENQTKVCLGGVSLNHSVKRTELIHAVLNFLTEGGHLDDTGKI